MHSVSIEYNFLCTSIFAYNRPVLCIAEILMVLSSLQTLYLHHCKFYLIHFHFLTLLTVKIYVKKIQWISSNGILLSDVF